MPERYSEVDNMHILCMSSLGKKVTGFTVVTAIGGVSTVSIVRSVNPVLLPHFLHVQYMSVYCLCAPGEASKGSTVPQPEEPG